MTSTTATSKFSEIFVIDLQLLVVYGGGRWSRGILERCIQSHDWRRLPVTEREDDVVGRVLAGRLDRCSIRNVMSVCVGAIGLDLDLDERTGRAERRILASQFSDVLTSPDSSFSTGEESKGVHTAEGRGSRPGPTAG